jgi:hypothetical protein
MGWFAVAAIFGFLLFWGWRGVVRICERAEANLVGESIRDALPALAVVLLILGLVAWALLSTDAGSFSGIVDAIGRGTVARFLLGGAIGFGLGYAIEQRVANAPAASKPRRKSRASKSSDASGGARVLLTVGFAAVFLALVAPHVDNWLTHISTLKSPVIELQLGSVAAHKVAVAENSADYQDKQSLSALSGYGNDVDWDIWYLENSKSSRQLIESARELLPAFKLLISPIAACMQSAMDNGLSIDSARRLIRPMADNLTQLVFSENNPNTSEQHEAFWIQLQALPEHVKYFIKGDQAKSCLEASMNYNKCLQQPESVTDFPCGPMAKKYHNSNSMYPKIGEYTNLPYLYVAASYLFSFMTDDDAALRVLRKAEHNVGPDQRPALAFKDYGFMFSVARLTYYLGKPGSLEDSYFSYLNLARERAAERIDEVKGKLSSCANKDCKDQLESYISHNWNYELQAINDLTYFLAEDLARDSPFALPYKGRAEEYAAQLERIVTNSVNRTAPDKYQYLVKGDEYYLMDSYVYMKMVLEARKSNPDVEKFKSFKREFQKIVERLEESAGKLPNVKKSDLTTLRIARAHLASARELSGE